MLMTPVLILLSTTLMVGETPNQAKLNSLIASMPRSALRTEYQPLCQQPLQYIGFSFDGPRSELEEMVGAGANAVGMGSMWIPVNDPDAPDGCGIALPDLSRVVGQTFSTMVPFDGFSPYLPTSFSTDSGCTWRLFLIVNGIPEDNILAEGKWQNVADNSWPQALFPIQAAGSYLFQLSQPEGTWIGWWSRLGDPYPSGQAIIAGLPDPSRDFIFRLKFGSNWSPVVSPLQNNEAVKIGPSQLDLLKEFKLHTAYAVGEWNNPGFPYYPDWFFENFPDVGAIDQNNEPILGGMFGKSVPAPGIEHPVIMEGASRYIHYVAGVLKDASPILYWVLGGEALYATYMDQNRWTDYSTRSIAHFREWLKHFRYKSIEELNQKWSSSFSSFETIEPPRSQSVSTPWLDWIDFRFHSMGERFGKYYQAARLADPSRMALSCNHGTLFHDQSYAAMGASFEIYGTQTDGFETGQIMTDQDPDYYNLLYTDCILGTGKPYCPVRLAYKKSDPTAIGGGKSYTPQAVRRYGYETLGAGAWHLGFIQWSGYLPDGEWGVKGTPGEEAIRQFHQEIKRLAPKLENLHAIQPKVGVWLSHNTWALRGFLPEWRDLHRIFINHQIPKTFLHDAQLVNHLWDGYEYLVSYNNDLVDPTVAVAIQTYLNSGGKVILAGTFPQNDSILSHPNVVRIPNPTPEKIRDHLLGRLQPIHLSSNHTVLRMVEEEIVSLHNTPTDLFGKISIGQTFRVAREGLIQISISMPTYSKVPPVGCTLQVRNQGPQGTLLVEKVIPGGISDNSWVSIEFTQSPAMNSVLYIAAIPHPELEATSLGWWGNTQDVYPDGQAFLNGNPTSGDRKVKLLYNEPVPGEKAIESFVLSDGLNYGVVLVNLASDEVRLNVNMKNLLEPVGLPYQIQSCLRPSVWSEKTLQGEVVLAPQDAEFLYAEVQVSAQMFELLKEELHQRYGRLGVNGLETSFAQYALSCAANYSRQNHQSKFAACALRALSQLGIKREFIPDGSGKGYGELKLTFFDSEGRITSVDRAWLEITPSSGVAAELNPHEDGTYSVIVNSGMLPFKYDYRNMRYEPFDGPVRLRYAGKKGAMEASDWIDLTIQK